jgi:hypothetical protein
MPVVINEFEVIPAPAETAPAEPAAPRPAASGLTPHDIEHVVERLAERAERVRAH